MFARDVVRFCSIRRISIAALQKITHDHGVRDRIEVKDAHPSSSLQERSVAMFPALRGGTPGPCSERELRAGVVYAHKKRGRRAAVATTGRATRDVWELFFFEQASRRS